MAVRQAKAALHRRLMSTFLNRQHRRYNGGKAEWWAERTFCFGRGFGEGQAILSYEIVTPFQMNQYLLGCTKTGRACLIDTGDANASLETAKRFGFSIKFLLQTHAHLENVMGLPDIRRTFLHDVPMYIHRADSPLYESLQNQHGGKTGIMRVDKLSPPENYLEDQQCITVGDVELKILHTPGHTPGHVSFYCEAHGFLIGGDLLFNGNIGRTDLHYCNKSAMNQSLRRVMNLPDETKVFPAHMMPTTIGKERRSNPFLARALENEDRCNELQLQRDRSVRGIECTV
ncbi:hypothetical protein GUITHDRAFT_154527 [Guillardia theta CCMP2712]|uniref:Metallo-beta-lactamase domain-containing protein n=1 Tax=Guillardia theta (strain CCMP2712) TaxID=905079 RepID=L1ISG1_GUITC|nr:hypothetical protein GUITHDRAFT_154527 [Guillardia theta CCMP2712]EKX39178.1 hypothetical protein GUITHDRAFT_154527 [Guillardia theta CCMP2712]|eukprot:XP_005826158.1 hypothetical protein GUITHDRAFT_154527 [Guillardia theta CCMP2712]